MRNRLMLLAIALACGIVIIAAMIRGDEVVPVEVTYAAEGEMLSAITVTGRLISDRTVAIFPLRPGQLRQALVREGRRRKGRPTPGLTR